MEVRLVLTPGMLGDDLSAVVRSRRAVQRFLEEHGIAGQTPLAADAVLVVSELVTNSILHAQAIPRVEVVVQDGAAVRVAVEDPSPSQPRMVSRSTVAHGQGDMTGEPDRIGGRGLLIVDQLASHWGVMPVAESRPGKSVWAELRRD